MEEQKKGAPAVEFESYLAAQQLDRETEERIAKEKSDKLTRLTEIEGSDKLSMEDKIKELLALVSGKFKEAEKMQVQRIDTQKKIKESEDKREALEFKRDKLTQSANMFKNLCTTLEKVNKELQKDTEKFVEQSKAQRAQMKKKYEDQLHNMSESLHEERLAGMQKKNEHWRNKILELSEKFKVKEKEMREMDSQPFTDVTGNISNFLTAGIMEKFQSKILTSTQLETEVSMMEEQNNATQEQLNLYIAKYDEVKTSFDKNDQALLVYDQNLKDLDNTRIDTKKNISVIKKEADSLSVELITKIEERKALKGMLDAVKARCEALQKKG